MTKRTFQRECQQADDEGDEESVCDKKISAYTTEDTSIAPSRVSNLKRHLKRFHPKVYDKVVETDSNNNLKKEQVKSAAISKINKFVISDKVTISMTPEKFKSQMIQMVVNNSIPLSFFSKPAFVGMNGEIASKFGISLDRNNVRRLLIDESKKETEQSALAIKNNHDVEASKLSSNRDKIREVFHMDVAEIIIEREQQRP